MEGYTEGFNFMYKVLFLKSHDWYLSVHHTILYYLLHFENILRLKEKELYTEENS